MDGGLGHTPVDVLASPAYLSSLAVSTKDPFVQSHLHLLRDVIAFAHWPKPTPFSRPHPQGGFFSHHYLTNSKKRVQAALVEAILLKRKNELMDHLCNSTSDAGLTLEDATALLITGKACRGRCRRVWAGERSWLWPERGGRCQLFQGLRRGQTMTSRSR